jgi:hypothetical protein
MVERLVKTAVMVLLVTSAAAGVRVSLIQPSPTYDEMTDHVTDVVGDVIQQPPYQPITALVSDPSGTTTVSVEPTQPVYFLSVTNDTTIAVDLSGLDLSDQIATWELWIKPTSTNLVVTMPSTNDVYYMTGLTPVISEVGQIHYTVWRVFVDSGSTNMMCNPWLTR